MAEYIEREAVLEFVEPDARPFLAERIKSIPAADVVPVVRCKACKFWNRSHISCEGYARCLTGESGVRFREANDFCSRGAKMEGLTCRRLPYEAIST